MVSLACVRQDDVEENVLNYFS